MPKLQPQRKFLPNKFFCCQNTVKNTAENCLFVKRALLTYLLLFLLFPNIVLFLVGLPNISGFYVKNKSDGCNWKFLWASAHIWSHFLWIYKILVKKDANFFSTVFFTLFWQKKNLFGKNFRCGWSLGKIFFLTKLQKKKVVYNIC